MMERWDGTALDINTTCADLGPKYLACMLSGCDTVSHPYGKGKISALNTLLAGNFPGLAHVIGEVGTTQAALMEAAKPFFTALYCQSLGSSPISYSSRKSPKIMALPPTSAKLLQHVLQAHLQVML